MNRSVATPALAALVACLFAVPAHAAGLEVEIGAEINLAGPGLVPVTVHGNVDPAALRVAGIDPVTSGRTDVDGDGLTEAVAHFDKERLISAGALDADTQRLEVTAGTLSGSDAVDVGVTLEVKLARPSSVAALGDLEPLVPRSIDTARLAARAKARSGHVTPDMGTWYRLTLPASTDVDATIASLRARSDVLYAYPAPEAAPPPQFPATPNFLSNQGYLRPAPVGTGADVSLTDPRTRGAGIRIADLEYYWTPNHEDLQLDPDATDLGKTTFPQYRNFADEHGTAVFGEMVAKDNGYGVTGGVPEASMHGISPTRRNASGTGTQYVPAAALTYVAQFLSPGDVVLIEQQTPGPAGGTAYVPLEWTQSGFDAMKTLSNLGIVVVETGGNGGQDLDSAPMMGRFDRAIRDSGAIIVGAGSSADRTALNFSSHGSRVDLQGWGQNIATTGSNGNLYGGNTPASVTYRYSRTFGGTSGAGPIVTNAVVAVQSYLKATGRDVWTSAQLIDLLRRTGTPQNGTRLVGPLPNIPAALREIEVDPPVTSASISPEGVNGWHLNPTVSLSADDSWGVGVDRSEYRVDGGAWTPYAAPFPVTAPGPHTVEFRSTDKRGNAETARSVSFNTYDLDTETAGGAGAAVPATLSLTLGSAASFGAFTPGLERDYDASTTANVVSTAGDATLSVADPSTAAPGRLVNGTFALSEPLQVKAGGGAFGPLGTLLSYSAPISNDLVTIGFRQRVGAAQALRTGTYSKTLTFTLSTTSP